VSTPSTLTPISIRTALSSAPPPRDSILPGLNRNTVGALISPGGHGKTTLAIEIAVALALGRPAAGDLLPAPPVPRSVALVSAEDPAEEFVIRLHTIIADVLGLNEQMDMFQHAEFESIVEQLESRLRIFPCAGMDMRIVSNLQPTRRLQEIIENTAGCDLAIIETVSRIHDGDENSASSMSAVVSALESWALCNNCAVLALHHTSKAADLNLRGDSQHAARGSSAFVDNVRYVANLCALSIEEAGKLGLSEQRKFYARFEVSKANYIPPQPSRVLRRVPGGLLKTVPTEQPVPPTRRGGRVLA
jgi:RecA-family ATPase